MRSRQQILYGVCRGAFFQADFCQVFVAFAYLQKLLVLCGETRCLSVINAFIEAAVEQLL